MRLVILPDANFASKRVPRDEKKAKQKLNFCHWLCVVFLNGLFLSHFHSYLAPRKRSPFYQSRVSHGEKSISRRRENNLAPLSQNFAHVSSRSPSSFQVIVERQIF
jgi:hypothetical protein